MPLLRITYIDDDPSEAKLYRQMLENVGGVRVSIIPPPTDWAGFANRILEHSPDLFLVDYELDAVQDDSSSANYHGSTLATEIREQLPGYPIVLLTRESIVDARRKQELQSDLKLIDHVVYKDEISQDPSTTLAELRTLALGFQALREIPEDQRDWESLLRLLGTLPEEEQLLKKAVPPLMINDNT